MSTIQAHDIDNTGDVPGKRTALVLGHTDFPQVTNTICRPN